jgi:membrane protein
VLFGTTLWLQAVMTGYVQARVGDVGWLGGVVALLSSVGRHVLPFGTLWLILLLLYKFLPSARVRFGSAAWGALLSAVLLQCAKPLFSAYAVSAFKYQQIYGQIAVVPLFLLWVWLLWVIVLFGAEVAFTTQNVGLLRYHDKLSRLSSLFVDRYLAARVMMYVAREFWATGRPVGPERLAEILQITPEEAADTAGRLMKLGLLSPTGEDGEQFHPARDLSHLKLSDVLSITDRYRDESRSARPEDRPYEDKLEAVFRSAIRAQDEALGGATFHDLLRDCEQGGPTDPRQPALPPLDPPPADGAKNGDK